MIISKKCKFVLSSIFYSIFSSLNLVILWNLGNLKNSKIKKLFSIEFTGFPLLLKVMIAVSIASQIVLNYVINKPVFQFKKK